MAVPIKFLNKRQAIRYSIEHIPYRVVHLEMCIVACNLISRGLLNQKGDLSVGAFTLKNEGTRVFTNMAIDLGLIYCRVLLNFLGIYRCQSKPKLQSRAPQDRYAHSEVWVERFTGGRLLTVSEVCESMRSEHSKQKMYWHIVRTLDASNRSLAHLTLPKIAKNSIDSSRIDSLHLTCLATRHHILEHFYRRTLKQEPPAMLLEFERFLPSRLPDGG